MKVRLSLGALSALFFLGLLPGCGEVSGPAVSAGWGIDAAYLTERATAPELSEYSAQLRIAGIGIVRGRTPNPAMATLRTAGFRVVSFLDLGTLPIEQRGDALPEDLQAVFAAARAMEQKQGEYVDVWEMVGEPDIGFCRDLPDRVVAFQKAAYLGIKAGAVDRHFAAPPIVLMGALALPPGPWLERAKRNGLLDYTDAYNFHFYGFADDLAGVIRAHGAFAERSLATVGRRDRRILPFWITECGMATVEPGDFLNPERRGLQAEFTVATARQAEAAGKVAVFMPFVLIHDGDPFALTLGPDRPLPAWTVYATYTRDLPFPARTLARPPAGPNPIVLQWLPDLTTAIPEKVSGSYRFWEREPIRGTMRIYNFGPVARHGVLSAGALAHVEAESAVFPPSRRTPGAERNAGYRSHEILVPPQGRVDVPMQLTPVTEHYFRDEWEISFDDREGGHSGAAFGLEARPRDEDFVAIALARTPARPAARLDTAGKGAVATAQGSSWSGLNGLQVEEKGDALVVSATEVVPDPLQSTGARMRVEGLPTHGFIRVQLDRPMDADFQVRVDLVDRQGQRFAIWENSGASYFGPGNDLWLNLADFNVQFWGRCLDDPVLHPADVAEIQLQCQCRVANSPRSLRLSFLQAPAEAEADSALLR